MPRVKNSVGLASLVETDSEPDLNSFDAEEMSTARPIATAKRPRGRPARASNPNRVVKPAISKPKHTNSGTVKPARVNKRQALADKGNVIPSDDRTGGRAVDEEVKTAPPRRGRPKTTKRAEAQEDIGTFSKITHDPPLTRTKANGGEAHEDGHNSMDEGGDLEMGHQDESTQLTQDDVACEPDLSGDADVISLKRRLGELMKKYQSLEARHADLKEVGVKEAELTFERLKSQTDQNRASKYIAVGKICSSAVNQLMCLAATKLIDELRAEISAQRTIVKEKNALQQQLELSEARIASLNTALTEAKSENKSLSNKLAAARSNEASSAAAVKIPGSALKGKAAATQAAAAASEAVQVAQMKEDLYADITGLIIRGVKHEAKEHVFDCIQTGRNGSK